MQLYATHSIYI